MKKKRHFCSKCGRRIIKGGKLKCDKCLSLKKNNNGNGNGKKGIPNRRSITRKKY